MNRTAADEVKPQVTRVAKDSIFFAAKFMILSVIFTDEGLEKGNTKVLLKGFSCLGFKHDLLLF